MNRIAKNTFKKLVLLILVLMLALSNVAAIISFTLAEETDDLGETTEDNDTTESPELGSITGYIWVEGDEYPLGGYTVYLYSVYDLSTPIAVTQTNYNGIYIFENLEPGYYVLGLGASFVNGNEYMLTEDCQFAVDWTSEPLMAYTQVIALEAGQAIGNINAGMRLVIEEIEEPEIPGEPEESTPDEIEENVETPVTEEPDEIEEPDEPDTTEPPVITPEFGSITGFIWVDGNGTLTTDWDGLYNGNEYPLGGYIVYLYSVYNTTFESGVKYTEGDRVVALSTCSYEFEDARYVVIGILNEEY